MEYMNMWEQEGFDRGIVQGMQKGLQQGVAETVLHLLNLRIGAIGLRTQAQIKKLPAPKLRDLSAALLNFSTRTELTTWLKNNG
jgi:predicted transposase YdaD